MPPLGIYTHFFFGFSYHMCHVTWPNVAQVLVVVTFVSPDTIRSSNVAMEHLPFINFHWGFPSHVYILPGRLHTGGCHCFRRHARCRDGQLADLFVAPEANGRASHEAQLMMADR